MPSHHTCSHSPRLRRYSDGCTTSGAGSRTDCVASTERTETAGSSVLSVCSDPKGIVGTSSACTDSAVTTWGEFLPFFVVLVVRQAFSAATAPGKRQRSDHRASSPGCCERYPWYVVVLE